MKLTRSAIFILAAVLSACGTSSPTRPTTVTTSPTPTPEDPGTNVQGDISLSLVGPAETPRGAVVPFAVRLQNITSRTIRLGVGGTTPAFDVIVQDASGGIVWNFMHGKAVAMIVKYLTLAPGEVVELRGVWSQQTNDGDTVLSGVYTVYAAMWTENGSLRSSTGTLRVR
jgi:intracellular proteinase inhibitor BsuPI